MISIESEYIAISKEWRLKFGFKIGTSDPAINLKYGELSLRHYSGSKYGYSVMNAEGVNSIEFVHQLQNLYFSLTGKELPIK